MLVLAIDPGPTYSGYVIIDCSTQPPRVVDFDKCDNERLRSILRNDIEPIGKAYIEEISPYGMAVGRSVFDTARWSGRFEEILIQVFGASQVQLVPRRTVKLFCTGTVSSRDGHVRAAIIRMYGGKSAIGTKAAPGPLYGIANDVWQALALALTGASLISDADNDK